MSSTEPAQCTIFKDDCFIESFKNSICEITRCPYVLFRKLISKLFIVSFSHSLFCPPCQ